MYSTLPLLGKQSHRISYSRKQIMENLGAELISRFGECPLSPCDTPGMCHPPSKNEGRPTHFLALRLQSPSLIRNVSISSEMIYRHDRYRKQWLKWIRITPRRWFLLASCISLSVCSIYKIRSVLIEWSTMLSSFRSVDPNCATFQNTSPFILRPILVKSPYKDSTVFERMFCSFRSLPMHPCTSTWWFTSSDRLQCCVMNMRKHLSDIGLYILHSHMLC